MNQRLFEQIEFHFLEPFNFGEFREKKEIFGSGPEMRFFSQNILKSKDSKFFSFVTSIFLFKILVIFFFQFFLEFFVCLSIFFS